MNCVNHPQAEVTAFCQNCGKGLCSACVRTVGDSVFCEPCLAVRIPAAPGVPPPSMGPSPGLATLLGVIPGVGAMYNGQYTKALIHVIVFVVLVGLSSHFWFFGLLIGFWVLYQVFDAHQTAKARRDGLPLPDPFGLNELGNVLGGQRGVPPAGAPPVTPPGAPGATSPPYPGDWAGQVGQQAEAFGRQAEAWGRQVEQHAKVWGQQAGQWGEHLRQRIVEESARSAYPPPPPPNWGAGPTASGFVPGAGYAPPPPPPGTWTGPVPPPVPPEMELERARREPIGAIILILLGMLFLFNTLGFFSFGWINHGWPFVVIAIAIWLVVRGCGGACFRFTPHNPPPPSVIPENRNSNGPSQPPTGGEQ